MNKDTHVAGVFASVSGLNVNTKLVIAREVSRSYWDLVATRTGSISSSASA